MPKILRARAAQEEQEERQVRRLAASRHGPADWIIHARMVARSPGWGAGGGHRKASCSVVPRRCGAACTASMLRASRGWATDLVVDGLAG